jgi:hypothetical protein
MPAKTDDGFDGLVSPSYLEQLATTLTNAVSEPGRRASDLKLSNPKDAIGSTKVPMSLVPAIVIAWASLAWLEGKTKYGGVNWRDAGVRASVYSDALDRHKAKWYDGGEDADKKTRVKHLASVIACAGILLDAELAGKLIDDRPLPQPELSRTLDELSEIVEHLKTINADYHPRHFTIADAPKEPKE